MKNYIIQEVEKAIPEAENEPSMTISEFNPISSIIKQSEEDILDFREEI